MVRAFRGCATVVQTEISQRQFDGLLQNFVHISMLLRGWIQMTLATPWQLLYHQQDHRVPLTDWISTKNGCKNGILSTLVMVLDFSALAERIKKQRKVNAIATSSTFKLATLFFCIFCYLLEHIPKICISHDRGTSINIAKGSTGFK